MTSTMEKLFAIVENISNTLKEIKSNQEELKASNEEIKKELKEIKERLDKLEEPVEEEVEESNEETMSSQDQMNAFFNCMMNTMQAHADTQPEVGSPYNEYPGYTEPSSDKDIEAIADRLRQNTVAQDKLNSSNFSSLDNFDFEGTFGGESSFNQNNEKPPEQVYHRVEPQVKQMNLDGMFHTQPTGNNWYGENEQVEPNKQFHIGLSYDRQFLIFRRTINDQNMSFNIARNSIIWNTIVNKLMKENRKLSSLNNQELAELSDYAANMTAKGIDVFSPINQNIVNQFNVVSQQNSAETVFDSIDTAPDGIRYQTQTTIPNNQYNQPPMQDFSRRNMTQPNSYSSGNAWAFNQPTNNMWANYGQDIINNSAPINQQPQQNQNTNFTTGGYTNPFNVRPVFNNSFGIFSK